MSSFTDPGSQGDARCIQVFRHLRSILGVAAALATLTSCAAPAFHRGKARAVTAEESAKDRLARLAGLMDKHYPSVGAGASPKGRDVGQVTRQMTRVRKSPPGRHVSRVSNSVDNAGGSPKERYIRQVTHEIEKRWHMYRVMRWGELNLGSLETSFYVSKKGGVEDLRIVNEKESNAMLTKVTLQAIKDAKIPPIPEDVLPSLPMSDPERLKMEYNVLIY